MFLPESKAGFPKAIYLDQNIWSNLAKTHLRKLADIRYKKAFNAIFASVENKTAIYPLGFTNFEETGNIPCLGIRYAFSKFMVALANNIFIMSPLYITRYEIINAVRKKLAETKFACNPRDLVLIPIREYLLWPGVHYVLGFPQLEGGSPELREFLFKEMHKPEFSIWGLAFPRRYKREIKEDDNLIDAAEEIERRGKIALKELREKERLNYEMLAFFTEGSSGSAIFEELKSLNVSTRVFWPLFKKREYCLEFFNNVPTYSISTYLYIEHHKNYQRKTTRNDLCDVMFLSVAIPYFNGIVMEKYWATIAKQAGLDKQHDTKIITDIGDVPNLLKQLGCI